MRIFAALISLALVGSAAAEQYWVEYDPSAGLYPEEVGWTRHTEYGGAERSFADGALVLDGLASAQITDTYWMYRQGELDPGAGELFVAQWRLRVDEVVGFADPGVSVFTDEGRMVLFDFDEGNIFSVCEPGLSAGFTAGEFHDFEVRSTDTISYELLIDGQLAFTGSFHGAVSSSLVTWGDGVQGVASLSAWESFEFGVIPEPSTLLMLCVVIGGRRLRR
jgi:hypothetical protein